MYTERGLYRCVTHSWYKGWMDAALFLVLLVFHTMGDDVFYSPLSLGHTLQMVSRLRLNLRSLFILIVQMGWVVVLCYANKGHLML